MEILENIYQIQSETPFRYRLNNYFIDDEKTCLIDSNAEEVPYSLIQGLKTIGKTLDQIDYVLISHLHFEHIRSLAYIKEHAPHCLILTSPWNADYLANFENNTKLAFQKNAKELQEFPGVFEFYHNLFSPIKSVQVGVVREGDSISLGNHIIRILETPGHCAEEISFYCEEKHILFSSDFIVGDNLETWIATNPVHNNYDGNRRTYLKSLQKITLLKDKIDFIFPAHGSIIDQPKAKIESLLSMAPKIPETVLNILKTGPKTLPELIDLYHNKKFERNRNFYNASRMMRALLSYLLEEGCIRQKGSQYYLGEK